jgi:hypothetical protein
MSLSIRQLGTVIGPTGGHYEFANAGGKRYDRRYEVLADLFPVRLYERLRVTSRRHIRHFRHSVNE